MKKNLLGLFLVLASVFVMPGPIVNASSYRCWFEGDWYAGGAISLDWHRDSKLKTSESLENFNFNPGGSFHGAIGYSVFYWRAELEVGIKYNSLNNIKVERFSGSAIGTTKANPSGHIRDVSFMLNIFYDTFIEECLSVYFGGGLGYSLQHLKASNFNRTIAGTSIAFGTVSEKDFLLSWQLMAGLNFHLNPLTTFHIGYRFFVSRHPDPFTRQVTSVSTLKAYRTLHPYYNCIEIGARFKL